MGRFVPQVDWRGEEVRDKVADACVVGIDATMAASAKDAKAHHPAYPPASKPGERYANRSGFATASTTIEMPATISGSEIVGQWGSAANHSLYLEIGTSPAGSGMPRAQVRAEEGKGEMWAIPGPSTPPLMGARMFLRPAASRQYPLLATRIAAAYNGDPVP